ncbi:hypothetical protein C731_0132 [Mycolicibacterium hassiacum DSM 44199]|uniref:Uncharacterized protein n=1 Tax=Mycolicibacterium hassiacum (strain DSM 44199 / CIP 105218 / JCM 12690 / 3849) TaxID=1122247 RepID=K5BHN6_MYCHD|nr:hypothetical protein C731_0132 [Mycolicibacterium hassiacum DSM 44199]
MVSACGEQPGGDGQQFLPPGGPVGRDLSRRPSRRRRHDTHSLLRPDAAGTNQLVGSLCVRLCCGRGRRSKLEPPIPEAPDTRGDDVDPNPDYDASDELEYGMAWFAWILRGVYPPPAYPPV